MDERIKKIEKLFLKPNEPDEQTIELVKQRGEVERILNGEPMAADDVEILFLALQGLAVDHSFHILRAVFQHGDDEFHSNYKKYNSGKSFAEGASECLGESGFKEISEGVAKVKAKSIKIDKSVNAIKSVNSRLDRKAQLELKKKIINEWVENKARYSGKEGFVRANFKTWEADTDYPESQEFIKQSTALRWLRNQ